MIIWLMGISGAGKSTLANRLLADLNYKNQVYLLDGDEVRSFFDNDLGYSRLDREQNVKRIIFAAATLEKNDIIVIVANISPFENLRQLCRSKFDNYVEIFLNRKIENAQKSDVKGVYAKAAGSQTVGQSIPFEQPLKSDLEIDTDIVDVETSLQIIKDYIVINKKIKF